MVSIEESLFMYSNFAAGTVVTWKTHIEVFTVLYSAADG